jgi:enoyl-CoA hydratase/carnithine racemase
MTNPIKTKRDGAILEVTLDRPKANAIDLATSRIMGEVFADFRDDPDLRVAIITGAGDKFFCPGWDLKAASDGDAVDGDYGVGGFGGLQTGSVVVVGLNWRFPQTSFLLQTTRHLHCPKSVQAQLPTPQV